MGEDKVAESVLGAGAHVLRAIAATTDRQRSPPVVKDDEMTEASPPPEHARTGWKKFKLMDRGEGEAAQEAERRKLDQMVGRPTRPQRRGHSNHGQASSVHSAVPQPPTAWHFHAVGGA